VKDEQSNHFKHLHIQWWVLVKKGAKNDKQLYQDYWVNKWKSNLASPKQWVDISNVTINSIIMINVNHATKAKQNLDVTIETSEYLC
jgi:hypothetical protein